MGLFDKLKKMASNKDEKKFTNSIASLLAQDHPDLFALTEDGKLSVVNADELAPSEKYHPIVKGYYDELCRWFGNKNNEQVARIAYLNFFLEKEMTAASNMLPFAEKAALNQMLMRLRSNQPALDRAVNDPAHFDSYALVLNNLFSGVSNEIMDFAAKVGVK